MPSRSSIRAPFLRLEQLFPGKGADLAAVVFAANMLKLDLTSEKRVRLMDAYLAIRCWPDAPAALRSLKNAGIRLAFLSNMTGKMLEGGIHNSGLEGFA